MYCKCTEYHVIVTIHLLHVFPPNNFTFSGEGLTPIAPPPLPVYTSDTKTSIFYLESVSLKNCILPIGRHTQWRLTKLV